MFDLFAYLPQFGKMTKVAPAAGCAHPYLICIMYNILYYDVKGCNYTIQTQLWNYLPSMSRV